MQDDFFLADEICSALEEAKFEVVGPFEAWSKDLDIALEQRPDAALFDMKMDRDKARGVLARLDSLSIPLVMATGHPHAEDAEQLANCSVLEKPRSVSKVIAAVKSALRLKQRGRPENG
ncbi:MAG: hypothetical protein ACSLE1_12510 [Sphingobium sp.]